MKADNVLVTIGGIVKVGDFGIAMKLQMKKEKILKKVVGTMPYMSPEMMSAKTACKASDIWGIGVTMLEACEKHEPRELTENVRDLPPEYISSLIHEDYSK